MSFQQGISGLNAAQRNLEVISNNIANANTVGAKGARVEFSDVYANAALHQLSHATGMGVRAADVTQNFGQGSLRTTDNPLDVAINGRGFFVVASPGGVDPAYTRNGSFQMNSDGFLVNNQGMRLQGYTVNAAGRPSGTTSDIRLPTQGVAPRVSATGQMTLNLDGRTPAPDADMPPFALGEASSYTSSTAMMVYDQQGNEHVLSMYFRRSATDNEWEVYTALDGQPTPAIAGGGTQVPAGRLAFGPDGVLDPATANLDLELPFPSATLPVPGAPATTTAPLSLSFGGSTQFGSAFGVTAVSQDGYPPGQLTGFAIDGNGVVQARYSNGQTVSAAQIALADFRNEQGLAPVGGNMWRATPASGQPAVGTPGSANLGMLTGGALEEANIDLTQQLVDMITAQRAYQANAQTIKTQDQMVSSLVNLR